METFKNRKKGEALWIIFKSTSARKQNTLEEKLETSTEQQDQAFQRTLVFYFSTMHCTVCSHHLAMQSCEAVHANNTCKSQSIIYPGATVEQNTVHKQWLMTGRINHLPAGDMMLSFKEKIKF